MYNMDNMKTMYIETVDKFPSDEKTNRRVLTIDGACRTGVDILQKKSPKIPREVKFLPKPNSPKLSKFPELIDFAPRNTILSLILQ